MTRYDCESMESKYQRSRAHLENVSYISIYILTRICPRFRKETVTFCPMYMYVQYYVSSTSKRGIHLSLARHESVATKDVTLVKKFEVFVRIDLGG